MKSARNDILEYGSLNLDFRLRFLTIAFNFDLLSFIL